MNMETKEILDEVAGCLNRNYYQDSGNYDIFNGSKPDAFLYNEHAAVAFLVLWSYCMYWEVFCISLEKMMAIGF